MKALEDRGIEYDWLESLGGHRKEGLADSPNFGWKDESFRDYADHMLGDEFRASVDRLLDIADNRRVAIMCAEKLFHDCHRRLTSGYQRKLTRLREEFGGWWYSSDDPEAEGWLCPALFRYFDEAPEEIYVKAEAK